MFNMTDNEILDAVLEEFKLLAKIPRPSHHEKAISDFLKDYFSKLGFSAVQDDVLNVIVDIPATSGKENLPLVVFQAHMDMVAVAAEGVPFNPAKDPIHIRRDENFLTAMGTSLGADDGIGIAIAMFLAKNLKEHGDLRYIFTVDEEDGMNGARELDKKYLTDAKYLINCDSEDFDEIIIGCAGNVTMKFSKNLTRESIAKPNIFEIKLSGLLGGHSGERIGDNRANAIDSLVRALRTLNDYGEFELVEINGGNARNAIPSEATAIIASDIDSDMLKIALMNAGKDIYEMYDEEGAKFEIKNVSGDYKKISKADETSIFRLVNLLYSGVYAFDNKSNLPETSANLGVIKTTDDEINISYLPRSSREKKLDVFIERAKDLADLTGFNFTHSEKAPGWYQRESYLANKISGHFKNIVGKEMAIKTMHAGIECGCHYKKNPNLDMASIGTTNLEIHSPRERLSLSTVAPIVKTIAATLVNLE